MANKHYPQQFKANAVALYRSRPGATIASIADDLGVNRETLRSWVRVDDQRCGARHGTAAGGGGHRLGRGRHGRALRVGSPIGRVVSTPSQGAALCIRQSLRPAPQPIAPPRPRAPPGVASQRLVPGGQEQHDLSVVVQLLD